MKLSIRAKSVLAALMHMTGVNSWKLRQCAADDVAILMYHRIIPPKDRDSSVQAGMVVEPDTLDLHLRYLRKNFEIIPLSELASLRHGKSPHPSKKPLCVLTFDDGWFDFYKYAFPILKTHDAPATVFLPTNFIGTKRWFWTDRVGFLLERVAKLGASARQAFRVRDPLLRELVFGSEPHEARLERLIAVLKPHNLEKIESILSELSSVLGADCTPDSRAFLSWEEVQEMYSSGFVSFGSHTAEHPILTAVTDIQAQRELKESMDALIAHRAIDSSLVSFSYPNGSYSEKLSGMVQEAGYHLAVTTQHGWHHKGANPYSIRRIALHQDVAFTEALFESRIASLL